MIKLLTLLIAFTFYASVDADAQTWVNGYTRSDGTYVQGHYRSTRDSNPYNNYSAKGNVNPYTGKKGTVNPYRTNNRYNGINNSGRRTQPNTLYGN